MCQSKPVITIDGPSGTGKGTISQLLAQKLNWNFLDSGALYRVLVLAAKRHAVDLDNQAALEVLAAHLDVQFKLRNADPISVILEGQDVTEPIRTEECSNDASYIAALPGVRKALLERQRAFCQLPGLVTDGRDMGTVVFPKAILKIYLKASREERAQRRYRQLKGKGINVNITRVIEDLDVRDRRDTQRLIAPLKPASDAVVIDTTALNIEQVFGLILAQAQSKLEGILDAAPDQIIT